MAMSRRTFLNTCLGLGVIAVAGRHAAQAAVHRERWYLFGTLVDVTLAGPGPEAASQALTALSADLQQRNRDWHPWKPGMMGDINQAIAAGKPIAVDDHMAFMIGQSQQLHRDSEGLFNPAIGKVIGEWGFHGSSPIDWHLPPHAAIEKVIATAPSPDDLRIVDNRLTGSNPEVQLDFGGYAKGYAIDLGRRLLASQGVEHALINAGGDLVTLGDAPAGDPWRVAVQHPQRKGAIAWLDTYGGEVVFTSGNYERYREYEGRRYPHIIDPRDGMPVQGVASATVVHTDGGLADAAATALVVAGVDKWREVAAKLDIDQAMVVDQDGRIEMTPAMKQRMHLVG